MKRWIALPSILTSTRPGSPTGAESEMRVQLHYRDGSIPDEIERFRICQGSTFFLTFLAGGMIDLNLKHVKEIRFETIDHLQKHQQPEAPNYRVSVSLLNGRTLEGYSDSLYSFSGLKEGTAWSYSCCGKAPEQVQAQNNLSRIVVKKVDRG